MAIVYQHRRLDTNEIFYIGIGKTEKRAYSIQGRNIHWKRIVEKYGYSIEIIHTGLSYDDAFTLEKLYIEKYGRRDLGIGCLVNMTDGGEGRVNISVSEKTRKKMSDSLKGRQITKEQRKKISETSKGRKVSEETKRKMSESNKGNKNNQGKKHSEKTKMKMSEKGKNRKHNEETRKKMSLIKKIKIVQIDINTNRFIRIWDSGSDASKELKINCTTITAVCRGRQKTAGGYKWKYFSDVDLVS